MNAHPWKTTLLRWGSWLVLWIGLMFDILTIRNKGMEVIPAGLRQQVQATRSIGDIEASKVASFIDLFFYCIAGIIIIATIVSLDYYQRSGQRKGLLCSELFWRLPSQPASTWRSKSSSRSTCTR